MRNVTKVFSHSWYELNKGAKVSEATQQYSQRLKCYSTPTEKGVTMVTQRKHVSGEVYCTVLK